MSEIEDTIQSVIKKFNKTYVDTPADSMQMWGSQGYAPTGLLALDYIIGRPGWPIGRFSEIAGPSSSAKSAIMSHTIGASQKAGLLPILLDLEHSYDPFWLRSLFGVNPDDLLCLHPENIESVFDQLKAAIQVVREMKQTAPIVAIIDSVSSAPSFKEVERTDGTESKQMAEHAKIISSGCRQLGNIWDDNVAVIFVSQLRDNPGTMYGTNTHKLGGKAIEFHCGLMVETRRKTFIKPSGKDSDISGYKLTVETKKNKFAPPFRKAGMEYDFYTGFDKQAMMIEFMGKIGMLKATQGWFEFEGKKCRRDELKDVFPDDQMEKVYKALGITVEATYEDMLAAMANTINISTSDEEEEESVENVWGEPAQVYG